VQKEPVLLYAGVLFVWPFIFDTVYTLGRRFIRGENIFEAHRSHLYQRLVIAGWSHESVTILYGILACAGWIPVGLMLGQVNIWYVAAFTVPVFLFFILITVTHFIEKRIV